MLWALIQCFTICNAILKTIKTAQDILHTTVKDGNNFQIEIALAGVKLADLDIETADGIMTISHERQLDEGDTSRFVHRGIAQRKFNRSFTLAEDVVVNGAKLENGMLYIALERIIPEEKKPRKIAIEQIAE